MERLDKVYANMEWLEQYPQASTIHLPKTYSDHNPILVSLQNKNNVYIDKHFLLETI